MQVQTRKSQWEIDIATTKASIARANQRLTQAVRSANLQDIINAKNELAGYESGLEVAMEYFAQLFPVEVAAV